MARYFMGGSRLEGWERMMMDPSRRSPAGADRRKTKPQKKPPRSQPAKPRPREREIRGGGV